MSVVKVDYMPGRTSWYRLYALVVGREYDEWYDPRRTWWSYVVVPPPSNLSSLATNRRS